MKPTTLIWAEELSPDSRDAIGREYRTAYQDTQQLDDGLDGWSEEGVWPDE